MNELEINKIRKEVEERTKIKEEVLGYEKKLKNLNMNIMKLKKSLVLQKIELNFELFKLNNILILSK